MTKQLAVRIPDELYTELDKLVDDGAFPTRADAVRAGLEALVECARQRRLDEAIVAGYRRLPPEADEEAWADMAGREMIADEPW